MQNKNLDPAKIVATVDKLVQRIEERFPKSGLANVCRDLSTVARQAQERAVDIGRPSTALRVLAGILIALIVVAFATPLLAVSLPKENIDLLQWIALLDSGLQDLVFIGAAIFFLITLEGRVKRRRALRAIHELRSLAHIIDMHQLTKDPERVARQQRQWTPSSPRSTLTAFELNRYLDYCSEMLSLVGKIAALYVQHFEDGVALAAASEVESLTTGLSRKIWQKITLLRDADELPSTLNPSSPS